MSGGVFTDAGALASALGRGAQRSLSATETVMRHSAKSLVKHVQHNASGRPGPRVSTGKYRASWTSEVHRTVPVVVGEVAPRHGRLGVWSSASSALIASVGTTTSRLIRTWDQLLNRPGQHWCGLSGTP